MRILGFIALVIAGAFFAHSIVSGGFPKFYPDEISALHSLDDQGLTLLVLLLPAVYVCLQPAAGFLLDRYGGRTTMMSAAILAALGLVLSVAVEIPAIGAAGRALHALGAGFAFVGALFIAARSFDKARFSTFAGIVQAIGFAGIGWWYLAGEASAALIDFPRRYYIAAGLAVFLALMFAIFGNVRPVQNGADRPGFLRQLLGGIGAVLVRPRLWLIMIAAAFAAAPLGLYAPIWIAEAGVPAKALAGLDRAAVATLFVLSFALGSLLAGFVGDGIGRRRGILVMFQLLGASAFAILAFSATLQPIQAGALVAAGGFFAGSGVLFYALGNDRAPPHHAGLFLGLIHAAFVVGAAGSVYAASYVQPLTDYVDLAQYFAPICAAIAAVLALITPDKGPMAIAGPVADWEKTATIDVMEQEPGEKDPGETHTGEAGERPIEAEIRDAWDDGRSDPGGTRRISSAERAGLAERPVGAAADKVEATAMDEKPPARAFGGDEGAGTGPDNNERPGGAEDSESLQIRVSEHAEAPAGEGPVSPAGSSQDGDTPGSASPAEAPDRDRREEPSHARPEEADGEPDTPVKKPSREPIAEKT